MASSSSTLSGAVAHSCACKHCSEIYKSPRLLPCLHTFCKECVSALTKTVGSKVVVVCPTCNDSVPVPPEGVDSFPVDLHQEHQAHITKYGKLMKQQPPPPCDECSRDPAADTVSFCCTCIGFLCQHCHLQHQNSRKGFLNHSVLILKETADVETKLWENLALPRGGNFCSQHVKEEIKLYCSQCKVLVCLQCALVQHSGHTMEDLKMFVKQEKASFDEMPDVIMKLDELINGEKALCKDIQSQKTAIEDKIEEQFKELQKCLNDKKAELLQQCSEVTTAKVTASTIKVEELSSLKDAIVMCNAFIGNVKGNYNESEYLSIKSTLQARIDDLKKKIKLTSLSVTKDDNIHFNADSSTITKSLSSFEVVSFKKRDYTSLSKPVMTVQASYPYHIAVHRNGDIFVANHTGQEIEVFNNAGTKIRSFQCSGNPLGVTVVGDSLYVVKWRGNTCQKLTLSGEVLCEIGSGQLMGPWGCAVSGDGMIYIAEDQGNQVQVFNPDGTHCKVLCSAQFVKNPRDVAIDEDGHVHITDFGSNCIKVFDPNGTLIREYGKGVLTHPHGVAVDPHGYCVVGDGNGKSIHFFDSEGKHLHKIGCTGLVYGVTFDDQLSVYAVEHSSKCIYKYQLN